jgi:hypothetical protein
MAIPGNSTSNVHWYFFTSSLGVGVPSNDVRNIVVAILTITIESTNAWIYYCSISQRSNSKGVKSKEGE